MTESVEKKVKEIIADISGFEPAELTRDTRLNEDLEVDSIKAIEITVAIEKAFKISVRDEDVPRILTVGDAVDTVEKVLGARAS